MNRGLGRRSPSGKGGAGAAFHVSRKGGWEGQRGGTMRVVTAKAIFRLAARPKWFFQHVVASSHIPPLSFSPWLLVPLLPPICDAYLQFRKVFSPICNQCGVLQSLDSHYSACAGVARHACACTRRRHRARWWLFRRRLLQKSEWTRSEQVRFARED